jgi:MFS family permease
LAKKAAGKAGLIVLFIAIMVLSVFFFIGGFTGWAFSGDDGWLALIIGSGVAFIGSILGVFLVVRGRKDPKVERERRPKKNIIIWLVIALISGPGTVLSYFFGMKRTYQFWLFVVIIALLGIIFLVSIFMLIFGWRQKPRDHTEKLLVENIESAVNVDKENN